MTLILPPIIEETGIDYRQVILRPSDGYAWSYAGSAFVAFSTANLSACTSSAFTENVVTSGVTSRYDPPAVPASLPAGKYQFAAYNAGTGIVDYRTDREWDGTAEVTVSTRSSHTAADVWGVGARTITGGSGVTLTSAYDPAKTAAQAGDAMALVTGAITASKIGSGAITTAAFASGATVPRVTLVDTTTTAGTVGSVTTGGATVRVTAPVNPADDNRLTLYQGDDHDTGERLPSWRVEDYTGPSLSGATAKLRIIDLAAYRKNGVNSPAADLEVTATVSQASTTVTTTAALSATQTAALSPSTANEAETTHYYHLFATTSGGKVVTLALGPVTLRRRVAATS